MMGGAGRGEPGGEGERSGRGEEGHEDHIDLYQNMPTASPFREECKFMVPRLSFAIGFE